jgi:tetratricopeptide (TPR) repeat protein
MRLFSGLCRGDDRHRRAFHPPPSVVGSEEFPYDERTAWKNEKSSRNISNPSPTTIGSDSLFTSTNSLPESGGSTMLDSPELQTPPPNDGLRTFSNRSRNVLSRDAECTERRDATHTEPRVEDSMTPLQLAEMHFHRGCELWAQDDFSQALEELETSKAIWERIRPHLVLLMQESSLLHNSPTTKHCKIARKKQLRIHTGHENTFDGECDVNEVEAIAQLYYAIGMVHLAMTNHKDALQDFRRSLQVVILGLGRDHHLVDATIYMMRISLLTMGYASPKIRTHIRLFMEEVYRERKADRLVKHGKLGDALYKYGRLDLLHDMDSQTRARILTKIATLHEEKKDFVFAAEIWSDLLQLYHESLSIGAEHPLVKQAMDKGAAIQITLERLEI